MGPGEKLEGLHHTAGRRRKRCTRKTTDGPFGEGNEGRVIDTVATNERNRRSVKQRDVFAKGAPPGPIRAEQHHQNKARGKGGGDLTLNATGFVGIWVK